MPPLHLPEEAGLLITLGLSYEETGCVITPASTKSPTPGTAREVLLLAAIAPVVVPILRHFTLGKFLKD
jgi:hypothetical protein